MRIQPLVLRSVVRLCRGGDAVASTALAKGRSFSVNKIEPDETRDATANADLNPWRVVSEAMYGDRAGLERGVNWLGVLAEAGCVRSSFSHIALTDRTALTFPSSTSRRHSH